MDHPGQIGFCKNTQCERVDADIPVRPGSPTSCPACGGGLYLRPVSPTLRIVTHCPALPACDQGREDHIEQIVTGRGNPHLKISCPGREPVEIPLASYFTAKDPEGEAAVLEIVGDDLTAFPDDDLRAVAIPLEPCRLCGLPRSAHSVAAAAPGLNPRSGETEGRKEIRCPERVARSRFRV